MGVGRVSHGKSFDTLGEDACNQVAHCIVHRDAARLQVILYGRGVLKLQGMHRACLAMFAHSVTTRFRCRRDGVYGLQARLVGAFRIWYMRGCGTMRSCFVGRVPDRPPE
jgi:hypothetical protein